jgi:hypothetical protein
MRYKDWNKKDSYYYTILLLSKEIEGKLHYELMLSTKLDFIISL